MSKNKTEKVGCKSMGSKTKTMKEHSRKLINIKKKKWHKSTCQKDKTKFERAKNLRKKMKRKRKKKQLEKVDVD